MEGEKKEKKTVKLFHGKKKGGKMKTGEKAKKEKGGGG